jgi:hypothetical protein
MSIAATQPVAKRIRWKAGKEDELWDYVQSRTASGNSISEALKSFADSNGISWLTARWKYYRLKQDRSTTIAELQEQLEPSTPLAPGRPDDVLEALSAFLTSASGLHGTDLTGLLQGLSNMAKAALAGEEAERTAEKIRTQYNELKQILQEYEKRFAQVRQEYETLSFLVEEWLNLHSVDRVTSMGDFGKRLRVQVDQFNRVLALAESLPAKQRGQAQVGS